MKMGEENRNNFVCNMSEVVEEEEEDEDEDVAALSSLENYQLCQKYQQVIDSLGHPGQHIEYGNCIDSLFHRVSVSPASVKTTQRSVPASPGKRKGRSFCQD